MDLSPAIPQVEIYPEEMAMNIPSFTPEDVYCSIIYRNKVIKANKLSNTRKLIKF